MNTRQELEDYLTARGIEFDNKITDEELENLVAERIIKEAQTS